MGFGDYQEQFEQFVEKHGERVEISSGTYLFADGAIAITHGLEGLPSFREPPSEPVERVKLSRRYDMAKQQLQVEPFSEFARRHGGNSVFDGGCFVFPDGASCDQSTAVRNETPSGSIGSLRARRRYYEVRLAQEIEAFHSFQRECAGMAKFASGNWDCPPPPADAAEQLDRGRQRIYDLRRQLAEIDRQLGDSSEERQRRIRDEAEMLRRRNVTYQLQDIMAIGLD
jgi:hypothetical protein